MAFKPLEPISFDSYSQKRAVSPIYLNTGEDTIDKHRSPIKMNEKFLKRLVFQRHKDSKEDKKEKVESIHGLAVLG